MISVLESESTVTVSWAPPVMPNGVITGINLSHWQSTSSLLVASLIYCLHFNCHFSLAIHTLFLIFPPIFLPPSLPPSLPSSLSLSVHSILGYRIVQTEFLTCATIGTVNTTNLGPDSHSFVLSKLESGAPFIITLTAINNAGESMQLLGMTTAI